MPEAAEAGGINRATLFRWLARARAERDGGVELNGEAARLRRYLLADVERLNRGGATPQARVETRRRGSGIASAARRQIG